MTIMTVSMGHQLHQIQYCDPDMPADLRRFVRDSIRGIYSTAEDFDSRRLLQEHIGMLRDLVAMKLAASKPNKEPTMTATLHGKTVQLTSRLVHTDSSTDEVKVDHVMGRDFAKRAYMLLADDDTGGTFRIAFYGNSDLVARADLVEAGWTNIRGITEHESITTIRNLP